MTVIADDPCVSRPPHPRTESVPTDTILAADRRAERMLWWLAVQALMYGGSVPVRFSFSTGDSVPVQARRQT
jgi:hypothetical protein